MRLLVVFAHPSTESFGYAILQRAVETLKSRGHNVEVLDLYRIGFDPLLSTEEWHSYLSATQSNIANVKEHVEKRQWAEGLVFVFPTFFFGAPKWWIWMIRDPVKSLFKRGMRPNFAIRCKYTWCQLYNMNHVDREEGSRFLDHVEKKLKQI